MRVLVFGDSITQGYWDTRGGWVDRLREYYDERQVQDLQGRDEPTVFNLGVSADNTEDILARIGPETRARTRHGNLPIVILQIGVNDSSLRGDQVQVMLEGYKNNLGKIVAITKTSASKLIFVGLSACDESKTMPVAWGEFYYTNEAIKRYEDTMAEVAERRDILFIPVFDAFKSALEKNGDLLSDGLHPNGEGHALIFDIVSSPLKSILQESA